MPSVKFMPATILIAVFFCSCTGRTRPQPGITKIIADTTGNRKATWDYYSYRHCKGAARQLSLSMLDQGADSIELRLWIESGLSNNSELYLLRGNDSLWSISYYSYYTHLYNFDEEPRKHWDSFSDPILDSVKSNTVRLPGTGWKKQFAWLTTDSLWKLPSQCEIPGDFGSLDGHTYILEIADKKRYKLLVYSNPESILNRMPEVNHSRFIHYVCLIMAPAIEHDIMSSIRF